MPETTPQHTVLTDPEALSCAELAEQIAKVHDRLDDIDDAIRDATAIATAFDKTSGQWHDLEHAAQQDAINDLKNKPYTQVGPAWDAWLGKYNVDEAAVAQAKAGEAEAYARASEEWDKVHHLHAEQEVLGRWLTAANYQSRTRCVTEPAARPRRRRGFARVAAGVATFALTVGSGVTLQHFAGHHAPQSHDDGTTIVDNNALQNDGPTAPKVSGAYAGTVAVATDPAGHKCCVKPATRWDVLQRRNTTTGEITITITNVLPGIVLEAPLAATGAPFRATATGTVAGFKNVEVGFEGTVTPQGGVHGKLVVGRNQALPQGQAIYFTVDMSKSTGVEATPV